jgi:hypothetical protein
VHFDTALNLTWLLLGAMALVATLGLSRRASFSSKQLHLVGVAAIVVALFPYISATDDVLRIERSDTQQTHENGGKHKSSDNLLRLFETLDAPLLCGSCRLAVSLIFLALLAAPIQNLIGRSIPLEAGRSPPLPYLA